MDMMSFVKTKHYELQVLVPFVGIWKPCAAPCPTTFKYITLLLQLPMQNKKEAGWLMGRLVYTVG